jgi:hypothetical protein
VTLGPRTRGAEELSPGEPAGWADCWGKFAAALEGGSRLKDLRVTVAGKGLVLTGPGIGYAGRPQLGVEYVLRYQDEEALTAQCPLADWDGFYDELAPPPTCLDAACRQACEGLVLARKARRSYHLAEGCAAAATDEARTACEASYPALVSPATALTGPALTFRAGYQFTSTTAAPGLVRETHRLRISTASGAQPLGVSPGGAATQASGALAFDRSPLVADAGYRFLVWYPGNQIADVSPSVDGASLNVIR